MCRIRFTKSVVDGDSGGVETQVTNEAVFRGRCRILLTADDDDNEIKQLIDESYEKIFDSISKFTRDGGGWVLVTLTKIELVVEE